MGKLEKFLESLYSYPIANDITFKEAARFLLSIKGVLAYQSGKGSSHVKFKFPGYEHNIVLMKNECLKPYQIKDIRQFVEYLGLVERDDM